MKRFIDEHRNEYGVEPICKVLPIAPSTYRAHARRAIDPALLSDRAKRDAELRPQIQRIGEENFELYGVRPRRPAGARWSGGSSTAKGSRSPDARSRA